MLFRSPEDISSCASGMLMSICDLTIATGGSAMVRAAYSSGKPAYGVGAGNATMVIDETADIAEAARNTRLSKTSDNGSGCSADGNLLVEASIYDRFLEQLQVECGYLAAADFEELHRCYATISGGLVKMMTEPEKWCGPATLVRETDAGYEPDP